VLLDDMGRPIDPQLQQALTALVRRFQRDFPTFNDDVSVIEALEEAARKIVRREHRSGSIDHLKRYAWVALRSVGVSRGRSPRRRLIDDTLPSSAGALALSALPTRFGTADQVEDRILLAQVLARLTPEERLVCTLKAEGFTSREIADLRGTSAGAIDVIFTRTKQKARELLGVEANRVSS
jgi:RNA polymerase sigma factor (sigma-70 family)